VSVATTLRKVAKQRRAIARPRVHHMLHWAAWHALQEFRGHLLVEEVEELAAVRIQREIDAIADRGALLYFGIRSSLDLGPVPIKLRRIDWEGSVALEVEPIAEIILNGGARSDGWRRANELTIDDLSR
jgi:hypothetical protein